MLHLVRPFASFSEASAFAKQLAVSHQCELHLQRREHGWAVFSSFPLTEADAQRISEELHDAELIAKDRELQEMRAAITRVESELARITDEREEFRRRVIVHERKATRAIGETISRSQSAHLVPAVICEACGRKEAFCVCAR
jgi:hypothetical protein